jgi:hypothetical protein
MKTKLLIAFLSIGLVASSCGNKKSGGNDGPGSSDEIELRLNLTKGKKYDMKMVMNSNAEMNMMGQAVNTVNNIEMGLEYEVMDVLPNGNFLVRTTYKKTKMDGETMAMKYSYDSETGQATGMQGEQMSKSMKKMIGQYTELELDKFGKVIKSTNSDTTARKSRGGIENFSFAVFPDKKIKVGDSWDSNIEQNMEGTIIMIKTKYKLNSVTNGIADISIDGVMEIKPGSEGKVSGTQKGTAKIEVATGLGKEVVIDQDMEMEMNDMGMKMPVKMKNKITITMN